MNRTYLDHAASTPMCPEAVAAMTSELTRVGNAASLHSAGRGARRVVEESREVIASRIGARPAEVIFTSGGTESDNLAVKGAYWARTDPARRGVLVSAVEHHAVSDPAFWLAQTQGADVVLLPVDDAGRLRTAEALAAVADPGAALVSVMWGNNEVGTLQPVAEVAGAARTAGVVSHSDAVQAVGHVPVDFAASGLDLMTLCGHKLGGPGSVGALVARRQTALAALLHGGGQERDVRSGSVDVAAVAGFAAAVAVAVDGLQAESVRVAALREELVDRVRAAVPDVVRYGATGDALLPGIACLGLPGAPADAVVMMLDAAGIDVSTGSACSAGLAQPSHVLMALGASEAESRSVVRFSLGHSSTAADLEALSAALPQAVARARAAAAFA